MTFRPSPPPPVLQPEPLPAPPAPEETVVATIPAIWPVEHPERRISSRFASSRRGGRRHKGIDIEAPKDTPIYATASGVVTFAGWQGAYGKIIVINHDNEYDTTYAHVGAFLVDEGDFVQLGQEIGLVGATGNATAFHVHYEVLSNGKHVNPEQWLP